MLNELNTTKAGIISFISQIHCQITALVFTGYEWESRPTPPPPLGFCSCISAVHMLSLDGNVEMGF
jgi:hypothetical protein